MDIVGNYAQFYDYNESILFAFILRQRIFTKKIKIKIYVIPIKRARNEPTKGLKHNSEVRPNLWDPGELSVFSQVFMKRENWLPLRYLQLICWCLAPNSSSVPATCTQAFMVFTPRANVKDAAAESF